MVRNLPRISSKSWTKSPTSTFASPLPTTYKQTELVNWQSRHSSSISTPTGTIYKTAGKHDSLWQNLPTTPWPLLPTKLFSYRSLYDFNLHSIQPDNDYKLSCPAVEECLDRMTTVHNYIYNVLKHVNYKGITLSIEKARQFNIDDWVLVDRWNLQVKAGKIILYHRDG